MKAELRTSEIMQNADNYTLVILHFLEVIEGYDVKVMMSEFFHSFHNVYDFIHYNFEVL